MWNCRPHVYDDAPLTMRALKRRDLPAAVAALDDPHARRMLALSDPPQILASRLHSSIKACGEHPHRSEWAIIQGGQVVGVRSLTETSPGVAITGSWIHQAYRGLGLGSASLNAVRQLAHEHLGITHLWSATRPDNLIAQRMLTSSGFAAHPDEHPYQVDEALVVDCVWFSSVSVPAACSTAG